jgi:hydroxymethylpyrimidine/phosphomethylpyrimidine kinase
MRTDKIKHYMPKEIFDYWTIEIYSLCQYDPIKTLQKMKQAKEILTQEINNGIIKGIEKQAELNLLILLTK